MDAVALQITDVIGAIPYRMALVGGWIDSPPLHHIHIA
jgi:hypothetical protein